MCLLYLCFEIHVNSIVLVKPHVSDAEYRQTEFIVQQFASGVGKELHKQLVKKAEVERNWV